MKTFAPLYYKDFKCIADKCRHSCCVGWEIDIDSNTEEKYSELCDGYGKKILESIDTSGTSHFKLDENERCPHLDSHGLCRIISELGEDFLCDICREHPRFYNRTSRGLEAGIGMACEEACRIILTSDEYREFYVLEDDGEECKCDSFDAPLYRDRIFSILADCTFSFKEKLSTIYYLFNLSEISDSVLKNTLEKLEYLDLSHKEMFLNGSNHTLTAERAKYLERALAYFVYRHCTEVEDEEDFSASLGFCLFCERLLASLDGDIFEMARIISEELEYSEENTEIIKNVFNE